MEKKINDISKYLNNLEEEEYKIYHLDSKKDNKLNNLKSYEEYDEKLTKLLLKSSLLEINKKNEYYTSNKIHLQKYIKNLDNETNKINVIYKKVEGMTYGRCNPIKNLGYHNISRPIRHTLCDNKYIDIDIKNCHPSILYQISLKTNLKLDFLKDYIDNRDKIFDHYYNYFSLDKDNKDHKDLIKNLFIRILYYGSYDNWKKDKKIDKDIDKFLIGFKNDVKKIGDKIYDYNKEIREEVQNNKDNKFIIKYNKIGSVVSYYLQEIECQILEKIYLYCIEKEYIKNNEVVLCADGLMLKKENYKEEILLEFNKLILDNFGFDLKFENKPFDNSYSIEKLEETQEEDFKFLKELISCEQNTYAKIYYNEVAKDKYIYKKHEKYEEWYEYNENNILINRGNKYPNSLLNNISDNLLSILKNEFIKFNVNDEEYKKIHKLYVNASKKLGNSTYIEGIIKFLKVMYNNDKIDELLDNDSNIIAFDNILYDFTEHSFRKIKKSDYISKTTKYKINEIIDENIQKKIYELLYSIFENDEIIKYWSLITATSLYTNQYESLYLNIGCGGNGKGLLSTIIEQCFGDYFYICPNTFLTSSIKPEAPNSSLYNCKGRRYVLVTEPEGETKDDECQFNESFIKLITGKDKITTRDLQKSNITYKPLFTTFIQCNSIPKVKKINESIERRFKFIKYPFLFVDNPTDQNHRKKNNNYKNIVSKSDFINQFMLYLLKTIKNNFDENGDYKDIIIPKECKETTEEYINDNNPLKYYIDRYLLKTNNDKNKIELRNIVKIFKEKGCNILKDRTANSQLKQSLIFNKIDEKLIYKSNGNDCLKSYIFNQENLDEDEKNDNNIDNYKNNVGNLLD
jgi:hypothetical protein